MHLWKKVGSTSRCTLARRDQSQVYHVRRARVEAVVYGQTQRIKFGRILDIRGASCCDPNQASIPSPLSGQGGWG